MRVLVAEDDLTIRTWLKIKLGNWGYDASLAEDGLQAWHMYSAQPYDLVITDWTMPKLDGISLIRKIKAADPANIPYIIMLTAKHESSDLITGIESGADDYMVKPVQTDELHARLIAASRILNLEAELRIKNATLERANTQMKNDLKVAAKIQRSFLPHKKPQVEGLQFEWGLLPCEELAGDALNIIHLDEEHVGIYLLDVSGHGVAAALMAMTVIHLLSADKANSILFERSTLNGDQFRILSPPEVMERLNQKFPMDDINGQYFTCIYGVLNIKTLLLNYASAGHPGPILISPSQSSQSFPSTGMPIGFVPDSPYQAETIQLEKGERLYFYSDGITESMNKYAEQFGTQRLISTLENEREVEHSLRASIDNLAVAALKWNGLTPMKDDVSVIGLEISP